MGKINLKKIIKKKDLNFVLKELYAESIDIKIYDLDDALIFSNSSNVDEKKFTRFDMIFEEEVIGHISTEKKNKGIANLINYIINLKEIESKLSNEILTKYKEINYLYNISEKISSSLNIFSISNLVIEELVKILNVDYASFMLINKNSDLLEIISEIGDKNIEKQFGISNCGIIKYVIETGAQKVINNVNEEEKYVQRHRELISFICSPLKVKDLVIGIIEVGNSVETDWTSDNLKFLNIFLSQISNLINNALLLSSYSRFLPREFLKILGKSNVIDLSLGDQTQREMAILFSDIRNFTSMSEKMSPKDNFDFINAYLKQIAPVIRNNGGFIDKYIGDAIMALFPNSADDAIIAAINMHLKLKEYNKYRYSRGENPISIGIGVNLCSRLESLTKIYGAGIIVSEFCLTKLEEPKKYKLRILDKVTVKGKIEPIYISEIMDFENEEILNLKLETKEEYETGISFFYLREFEKALDCFQNVIKKNSRDIAAYFMLDKCKKILSLL